MSKKINIKNIAFAFGAGAAGAVLTEQIEKKLAEKALKDGKEMNEQLAPGIVGLLGVALHYFGKGKMDAAAYGLIGASGADLGYQGYLKITEKEGEGAAANGLPSSVSPEMMNGLKEKIIAMRSRGGGKKPARSTAGTAPAAVVRSQSDGDDDFYDNPYAEYARRA